MMEAGSPKGHFDVGSRENAEAGRKKAHFEGRSCMRDNHAI